MNRVIHLAQKGYGKVSPNPLVGSVIVKEGKIVGEGYHKKFGEDHAEIQAIKNSSCSLADSTLYVNLEPCAHYGKTPPCVDTIIKAQIKKVVIAQKDPNPIVNGKGIKILEENNIVVQIGVLEKKARILNEKFNKRMIKKQPFIAIKIAQTLDGKIADQFYESKWITNLKARKHVHHIRKGFDAIITGAGTIRTDNPLYTVRHVRGKNPDRFIITNSCQIPQESKILELPGTYIITDNLKYLEEHSLLGEEQWIYCEKLTPEQIIQILGLRGYQSILIEAGEGTASFFIESTCVDRYYIYIAPKILGPGRSPYDLIRQKKMNEAVSFFETEFKKFDECLLVSGLTHEVW